MPNVIRNQQFALLQVDSERYFNPTAIDARDEDEAQELAVIHLRLKKLTGNFVLVKLICDYADGSGPSAIYVGKD